MGRFGKTLAILLAGGALLQTTSSCQELVAPLITNVATSLILEVLLGGLAT